MCLALVPQIFQIHFTGLGRFHDHYAHSCHHRRGCVRAVGRTWDEAHVATVVAATAVVCANSQQSGELALRPRVRRDRHGRVARHPFVPAKDAAGMIELAEGLESWLATVTGYAAVSIAPNAGSQGEFTGLLAIGAYHRSRGDHGRNVCLIPSSAHGTNAASAVMAGMRVVVVKATEAGEVDLEDLRNQCETHSLDLAAIMVTYPSTHGVYEHGINELCEIVHTHGGQVYVDGANLNLSLIHISEPTRQ